MLTFKVCFIMLSPSCCALFLPGAQLPSLLLYNREALNSWYFLQYSEISKSNLDHTATCSCYRGATNMRAEQRDAGQAPGGKKVVWQSVLVFPTSKSHTALTLKSHSRYLGQQNLEKSYAFYTQTIYVHIHTAYIYIHTYYIYTHTYINCTDEKVK